MHPYNSKEAEEHKKSCQMDEQKRERMERDKAIECAICLER